MSRSHQIPDPGHDLDLHQALYCAARDYRGGMTAVAAIMATNYNTLQKKLNLANDTHFINLTDFEQIANITDDSRIDEAYARMRGKMLFEPAAVGCSRDALKALSEVLSLAGDFVASLNSGMADKVWEVHEVAELEFYGNEVISKVLGIVAGAKAEMEAQNETA